ncbi:hypothetical protein DID88_002734 [Monilinia fructigena]|uniref:Uncharacterized protein n=1 Tax=Monilinia fructigena TaxID=38457 RepID=A0A395IMY5_9HELO|nr:hypothetical protein DID88_002734 [Monilinia fructigena]
MSADIQRSNGHGSSATGHLYDLEQNSDLGNLAKSGISAVIIGSEWHFKPAGVMEVEKRFAERLSQMRAEGYIQWRNQDHHFQLSSERHLIPLLQELNRITREIIIEEGGDRKSGSEDDDDDDDDTCSDLSTEFHSNLIEKVTHYEPLKYKSLPNPATDDIFYPDVIKKLDYRGIWMYYDGSLMDKILKLAIVQELEAMTGSKIVKSPSESKVYIGSDKNGSVDLVVAKLDNIAKYSLTNTLFFHIFYTEELELCKFAIKAFPEIKKKFLETTLMEQMPFPEYLSGRLTVRACSWNAPKVTYAPVKIGKYTAAVPSPGAQIAATKLWVGKPGRPGRTTKNNDDTSMHFDIAGWVENASTTADPSQKLTIEEWRGTVDITSNPLARLALASEPEASTPKIKANNEEWNGIIHKEMAKDLDMLPSSVEDLENHFEPDTNILKGWSSPDESNEHKIMQSSLLDSELDAELTNSDWNALRNNASENALIDISSSPTRSPNLRIFEIPDGSNAWDTAQFMALEPPASLSSLMALNSLNFRPRISRD